MYHTYLALAALALDNETGDLGTLDAQLNVEQTVSRRIRDMLAGNATPSSG